MKVEYAVKGMTCGGCANAVKRAILAVSPDARVEVELPSGVVRVVGAADEKVQQAVEAAGFEYVGRR